MKISRPRSVSAGRFGLDGSNSTEPSTRTDLVRVAPVEPTETPRIIRSRPQAAYLAHLLAVAQRAPQTQEKRRAEPREAINRYTAAGLTAPARPGRAFKRAV